MGEVVAFFIFSAVAIIAAIAVVSLRNPVHSVISLMVCFLQMAAIFILLHSPFIAVIQVFVYVGAVLVLFLFVIMLLDIRQAQMERIIQGHRFWMIGILGVMAIEMIVLITGSAFKVLTPVSTEPVKKSVHEIGKIMFNNYILPFEVVSFILLVALLGAIVLGRKELKA